MLVARVVKIEKTQTPPSMGPRTKGETGVWPEVSSVWQLLLGWKALSE